MHVFFQADPLSSLKRGFDTSLILAFEAHARGWHVFFYEPHTLTYCNGQFTVRGSKLTFTSLEEFSYTPLEEIPLEKAQVIFIRQDPPFDMAYLTSLYLLNLFQKSHPHVFMVNNPQAIRFLGEKLIPLLFSHLAPPTLITREREKINHCRQLWGDIVLKPLYAGAGKGVLCILRDDPSYAALIELFMSSYKEPFVVQKYLPAIRTEGDRRFFLLDGEIIGGFKRIPPPDDIRANTIFGAHVEKLDSIKEKERSICDQIAQYMRIHDLFFAGVDILDSCLIEVNITSPGGLYFFNKIYPQRGECLIWERIETCLTHERTTLS